MARAALRDMLLRKDTANIETTRRLSESEYGNRQGKEENVIPGPSFSWLGFI